MKDEGDVEERKRERERERGKSKQPGIFSIAQIGKAGLNQQQFPNFRVPAKCWARWLPAIFVGLLVSIPPPIKVTRLKDLRIPTTSSLLLIAKLSASLIPITVPSFPPLRVQTSVLYLTGCRPSRIGPNQLEICSLSQSGWICLIISRSGYHLI